MKKLTINALILSLLILPVSNVECTPPVAAALAWAIAGIVSAAVGAFAVGVIGGGIFTGRRLARHVSMAQEERDKKIKERKERKKRIKEAKAARKKARRERKAEQRRKRAERKKKRLAKRRAKKSAAKKPDIQEEPLIVAVLDYADTCVTAS